MMRALQTPISRLIKHTRITTIFANHDVWQAKTIFGHGAASFARPSQRHPRRRLRRLVLPHLVPRPLGSMSGVSDLFVLMLSVDVVQVQLGALGYGMWTVFAGRPVHGVFKYDRIRMVHAIEIPEEFWSRVSFGMDIFTLTDPTLLALPPFKNKGEQMSAAFAALNGVQMSVHPEQWMPYSHAVPEILKAVKPSSALIAAEPGFATPLQEARHAHGRIADTTVYLPLAIRAGFCTALLDATTAELLDAF